MNRYLVVTMESLNIIYSIAFGKYDENDDEDDDDETDDFLKYKKNKKLKVIKFCQGNENEVGEKSFYEIVKFYYSFGTWNWLQWFFLDKTLKLSYEFYHNNSSRFHPTDRLKHLATLCAEYLFRD